MNKNSKEPAPRTRSVFLGPAPWSRRLFTGFTFIELLIIIAIIGLLAAIILISLNTVRARARDASRVSTLDQMGKLFIANDSDTATAFAGCNTIFAHSDVQDCTGPFTFPFRDPSYKDATHPGPCGVHPAATCQFSISKIGGLPTPNTQSWQICTYLEGGVGQYPAGYLSITSATTTPFSGPSGCL